MPKNASPAKQDLAIETARIDELRPHPRNPRIHPDRALQKLADSIRECGWTNPILLSVNGVVRSGDFSRRDADPPGYLA